MENKRLPVAAKVAFNRRLISDHYLMNVRLSEPVAKPLPGQFIMVMLDRREGAFLGRPFSIYGYATRGNKPGIDILYRVVGRGTSLMADLERGDAIHIFGPHGKSFEVFPEMKKIVLISGGMGVAPISYLASHYKKDVKNFRGDVACYMGATTSDQLFGMDRIGGLCSSLHISTDDGSAGFPGTVTELFARDLSGYDPCHSVVYACGPSAMLKRLASIIEGKGIQCQVLLEERMACGVGACLGCVVEVKHADEESRYARVCMDGPVFDIGNINWSTSPDKQ
jgi:dihydroorotate dehydrogenase electron transfer subunit